MIGGPVGKPSQDVSHGLLQFRLPESAASRSIFSGSGMTKADRLAFWIESGNGLEFETRLKRVVYAVTGSHPDFISIRRSLTASTTAYFASSRVESNVGSDEFSSVTMSGISVQPRTTHSAPLDFRSSIAPRNIFVVPLSKIPKHSSSKIAVLMSFIVASSGIRRSSPRFFNAVS